MPIIACPGCDEDVVAHVGPNGVVTWECAGCGDEGETTVEEMDL